jgi:hypothetical protein
MVYRFDQNMDHVFSWMTDWKVGKRSVSQKTGIEPAIASRADFRILDLGGQSSRE